MNQYLTGILLLIGMFVVSCGRLDDRLKEQADIQGRASAEASEQISSHRALEMEAELRQLHSLYQSFAGTFQGQMVDIDGRICVELPETPEEIGKRCTPSELMLLFVPSVWPYEGSRLRTTEEIAADLMALSMSVQVNLTLPTGSRASCHFSEVRPNPATGEVFLTSSECSHHFRIYREKSGERRVLAQVRSNRNTQNITIALERVTDL